MSCWCFPKTIRPKERPKGENVVDLMEALRQSVGQEAVPANATKPAKKAKKTSAGQKEMLMPDRRREAGEGGGGEEAVGRDAAEVGLGGASSGEKS